MFCKVFAAASTAVVAGIYATGRTIPFLDHKKLQECVVNAAKDWRVQAVAAVAAGAVGFKKLKAARAQQAFQTEIKEKNKKDVVYIYIAFPRGVAGLPHVSAWQTKIETWCRLHKVPYVFKAGQHFAAFSPSETLPFVALNGESVGDSERALQFLSKKLGKPLYEDLSAEEQGKATLLRHALTWHLSPNMSRTMIVDNTDSIATIFASLVGQPVWLLKIFLSLTYRPTVIKNLMTSGLGWTSDAEYVSDMVDDLKAIESLLPNANGYLFGRSSPTTMDCVTYGVLANMSVTAPMMKKNGDAFAYAANSAVLKAYVARMEKALWPDLAKIVPSKETTVEHLVQ